MTLHSGEDDRLNMMWVRLDLFSAKPKGGSMATQIEDFTLPVQNYSTEDDHTWRAFGSVVL